MNLQHPRLFELAAVVLPFVLVKAAVSVVGGPSEAWAMPDATPEPVLLLPPSLDAASPALTDQHTRALEWASEARRSGVDRDPTTPFARPESPAVLLQPEPAPEPEPHTPDLPAESIAKLRLTLLIGQGESVFAVIENRRYRPGDEVRPGWRVLRINPRLQTVDLQHTQGEIVRLSR